MILSNRPESPLTDLVELRNDGPVSVDYRSHGAEVLH